MMKAIEAAPCHADPSCEKKDQNMATVFVEKVNLQFPQPGSKCKGQTNKQKQTKTKNNRNKQTNKQI